MSDKGDKSAARPPEVSLVETRCLIKGPKSAIVPFAEPRSGPESRTGPEAPRKKRGRGPLWLGVVAPLRARVDPGRNSNKGVLYTHQSFYHYWSFTIRLFSVISRTLVEVYVSAEMLSVYSTRPADDESCNRIPSNYCFPWLSRLQDSPFLSEVVVNHL